MEKRFGSRQDGESQQAAQVSRSFPHPKGGPPFPPWNDEHASIFDFNFFNILILLLQGFLLAPSPREGAKVSRSKGLGDQGVVAPAYMHWGGVLAGARSECGDDVLVALHGLH